MILQKKLNVMRKIITGLAINKEIIPVNSPLGEPKKSINRKSLNQGLRLETLEEDDALGALSKHFWPPMCY